VNPYFEEVHWRLDDQVVGGWETDYSPAVAGLGNQPALGSQVMIEETWDAAIEELYCL
jgi:hypothetical protein